jgi:hypothetical protein
MITDEEIRTRLDKLATLGTPDAIAWELEAQGIKGKRRRSQFCAIAVYLGNDHERTAWDGVGVCSESIHNGGALIPVPPTVGEFIDRFDSGQYPNLVRTADEPF